MTPGEVAAAYLAAFATGDPDSVAALVTDDFVNEHTAALGGGCVGREAYRQRLPGFLGMFAGLRYDVETLVVEGDTVAAMYMMHASWQGDAAFTLRGVMHITTRDQLVAKRVDYWDSLQFLLQVDPGVRTALANWL